MATNSDEDLKAQFIQLYRENLLQMIRNLKLNEGISPSRLVHLQDKKKEVQVVHKALEQKQEEFKERMKVVTQRWKELQAKEAELKTHMEDSKRLIKESEEMQMRALKKATEEREKRLQKEKELLRAKRDLEALRTARQKLSTKVQKYSIFCKYLEDVVKNSEFEDIQEIVLRYKTLVRMRKDLLQSQQQHQEVSEQTKLLLDQYKAKKEAEMLQYQKELQDLQRLEQIQNDVCLWEGQLADIKNTTSKKAQELATIRTAIFSLFQTVQKFIQDRTDLLLKVKWLDTQTQHRASLPLEIKARSQEDSSSQPRLSRVGGARARQRDLQKK
ncbi:coiled-coil domain-containing protein 42 isoform X1 [Heliangelus exortis]|uniref:coiled-coil domain-containing protein 42 isoform X1 n=1 Tax=Heliangelus exortis TaxID=472823 RepID=UPI003A9552A0